MNLIKKRVCIPILLITVICATGMVSVSKGTPEPNKEKIELVKTEFVTPIYYLNWESEDLDVIKVLNQDLDENTILNNLKAVTVIPVGTKILDFEQKDKDTIYINFSKELYNMNLGSSFESLSVSAISKTYLSAFNAKKIILRVEGKPYESGHLYIEELTQ